MTYIFFINIFPSIIWCWLENRKGFLFNILLIILIGTNIKLFSLTIKENQKGLK